MGRITNNDIDQLRETKKASGKTVACFALLPSIFAPSNFSLVRVFRQERVLLNRRASTGFYLFMNDRSDHQTR